MLNKINFSNINSISLNKPKNKNEKSIDIKSNLNNTQTISKNYSSAARAYAQGSIAFAGSIAKDIKSTELYSDFEKTVNADSSRIYEFITSSEIKKTPTQTMEFLLAVTANDKLAEGFIKEITANPRESKQVVKNLINELGGKKNFNKWYWDNKGYYIAFDKFNRKLFDSAESVSELIKFNPTWSPRRIKEKTKDLSNSKNYSLGSIPDEFKDKKTFNELNKALSKLMKEKLDNTCTPKSRMSYDEFKAFKHEQKSIPSQEMNINGQSFRITGIPGGLSGEGKFTFFVETGDKKFIIKKDDLDYRKNQEPDSIGLNANIDYYLTENDCKNSCKIFYYEYETNTAIYEFIEKGKDQSLLEDCDTNPIDFITENLPDLTSLGIYYNDMYGDITEDGFTMNKGNFMIANDNHLKTIDMGHTVYADPLKPMCKTYHRGLPNICGFDLPLNTFSIGFADDN